MSAKNVLINLENEPIDSKHISWNVYQDGNCIVLQELVENYYEHPQAKGYAVIPKLELIEKKRVFNEKEKAPLKQLINALQTIDLLFQNSD
ncbi:MAG: hypothetical protein ACOC2U_05460 [bacterium]